ncbi:MAG: hypothetical protein AzoDbin1_05357 [Azoarcus sp.]|nr:hypothetical protein [Azoarcus sp.]
MEPDFQTSLRERLEAHRGYWRGIAERSGLSYSWLSQFARGVIRRPAAATLLKLQAHLPDETEDGGDGA